MQQIAAQLSRSFVLRCTDGDDEHFLSVAEDRDGGDPARAALYRSGCTPLGDSGREEQLHTRAQLTPICYLSLASSSHLCHLPAWR